MSSTALWTDESSLMIDYDAFLMSIDGMNYVFSSVLLNVSMIGTALTTAASVLQPDFLINDTFVFKFLNIFKFFFIYTGKQYTI